MKTALFISLTLTSNIIGAALPKEKPNIVLFLADDLGWRDLGCYGNTLHQTPHIDQLAWDGTVFTQAYAAACSCSPTRASIMTGKYPARLHMTSIIEKHRGDRAPQDAPLLPPPTRAFLPLEETTIAEVLKGAGYAICLVGKWHLGEGAHAPQAHGFDRAIAPPHKGMPKSYFWPQWENNPKLKGRFEGEYLTDRLAEEACQFIKDIHAEPNQPFFLHLSFHSVHVPIEAKQEKVRQYQAILNNPTGKTHQHQNAHYAAMVESLDDAVGQVLGTLKSLHLEGNTLVAFFSDNGGLAHPSHVGLHTPATTNKPLRSGKGLLYEGGIRVPLILKWPDVIPASQRNQTPTISHDLFPTFCAAAGKKMPDLPNRESIDGENLLPLLRDREAIFAERDLFWHYPHFSSMGGRPSGAIRSGPWKLIEHLETKQLELYHLVHDIGESKDLSRIYPDQVKRLHGRLLAWRLSLQAGMMDRPNPAYAPRP